MMHGGLFPLRSFNMCIYTPPLNYTATRGDEQGCNRPIACLVGVSSLRRLAGGEADISCDGLLERVGVVVCEGSEAGIGEPTLAKSLPADSWVGITCRHSLHVCSITTMQNTCAYSTYIPPLSVLLHLYRDEY